MRFKVCFFNASSFLKLTSSLKVSTQLTICVELGLKWSFYLVVSVSDSSSSLSPVVCLCSEQVGWSPRGWPEASSEVASEVLVDSGPLPQPQMEPRDTSRAAALPARTDMLGPSLTTLLDHPASLFLLIFLLFNSPFFVSLVYLSCFAVCYFSSAALSQSQMMCSQRTVHSVKH